MYRSLRGSTALLLLIHCVCLASLQAASRPRYTAEQERTAMLRDVLDNLHSLRYEVSNHEAEIRMLEGKILSQEELIDSLRQQLENTLQVMKDTFKTQVATLDSKISGVETGAKGLAMGVATDLKTYAADAAAVCGEYKKRIGELERTIETQNRNIDHLQAALSSVIDVVQDKDGRSDSPQDSTSTKVYKVKSGDSLEKIARQNNTTIKKIKELNNLSADQINIGQKLHLPE